MSNTLKINIPLPLHFDSHGINDNGGSRVSKVMIERYEENQRMTNPDFQKLSVLFEKSPQMFEMLVQLESTLFYAKTEGTFDKTSTENEVSKSLADVQKLLNLIVTRAEGE